MDDDLEQYLTRLESLRIGEVESKSECFPRCEYCVRYEGTSAFKMLDPDFWGSYFRSTARGGNSDRLAKSPNKYFRNCITNLETAPISKTGAVKSPWESGNYNSIFTSSQLNSYSYYPSEGRSLYDLLLNYKNLMAHKICTEVNITFLTYSFDKEINVYCCNEYPCVMVTVPKLNALAGETSSIYLIVCSYFIAFCNATAEQAGIPIEMVFRSSFGHNGPSVSETSTSIRINIGIFPNVYCGVIKKALFLLNELFLIPLLNKILSLNFFPEDVETHNSQVEVYNFYKSKRGPCIDVAKWEVNEPLLDVLCKVGDSGGKKVSFQITRLNKYTDLLSHYVTDQINNYKCGDMSVPILNMLHYLVYEVDSSSAVARLKVTDEMFLRKLKVFQFIDNAHFKDDYEFWTILNKISNCIDGSDFLDDLMERKTIYGLYACLELANLNFIRKCYYTHDDDQGSDCECEINETPLKLFSKKIVVSTGMRAINLSYIIALYKFKQMGFKPVADTSCMYYETSKALRSVAKLFDILNHGTEVKNACIKFVDLNYCATSEVRHVNVENLDLSPNDIVILDCSSAYIKTIHDAVMMLSSQVLVVILVSSGLKNEQVGADMNPYGTVRIFSKDKSLLNELYSVAKMSIASEILPKNLHRVRKAYKRIGAAVTAKSIFNYCIYSSFKYEKGIDFSGTQQITTLKDFHHILKFINDNEYRERICIPFFESQLFNVFLTFLREDALDELLECGSDLCDFSDNFELRSQINVLSIVKLRKLLFLLQTSYDELTNLINFSGKDLSSLISWDKVKFKILGSKTVEEIINDTGTTFEMIYYCYEKDSDIVSSILEFYRDCELEPYILFDENDFQSVFDILFDSQFENDMFLSYEDILRDIFNKSLRNQRYSSSESYESDYYETYYDN